ncbi:hypothetical protein HPB48_001959 [Haemaphysalis longicornis]|uniref:Peptidase M13 N-terminal domain-containing protein n=1 Tax=Haemaphysalis longicornis TaxID=44386 RepID=A0A9J6G3J4_HAELO|nr:hypothetical protein HPB48_001959 [Haemaphysalis longicornis]
MTRESQALMYSKKKEKKKHRKMEFRARRRSAEKLLSSHADGQIAESKNLASSFESFPDARVEQAFSRGSRQLSNPRQDEKSRVEAAETHLGAVTCVSHRKPSPPRVCDKQVSASITTHESTPGLGPPPIIEEPPSARPLDVSYKTAGVNQRARTPSVIRRGRKLSQSSQQRREVEPLATKRSHREELETAARKTRRRYIPRLFLADLGQPSRNNRQPTTNPTHDANRRADLLNLANSASTHSATESRGETNTLFFAAIFLATGILVLAVLLLFFTSINFASPPVQNLTASKSCLSEVCRRDAAFLDHLLAWDFALPCDNFYTFVCRKWKSQFATAPSGQSVSLDEDYVASVEGKMFALVDNRSHVSRAFQPFRNLMDKCMDAQQIENDGWDSLLELMAAASIEVFPQTPPSRSSISVWKAAGHLFRKTGVSALLSAGATLNPLAPHEAILSVGPPDTLASSNIIDANQVMRLYTDAVFSAIRALRKDFVPAEHSLKIVNFAGGLETLGKSMSQGTPLPYKVVTLNTSSHLFKFLAEVFPSGEQASFVPRLPDVLIRSPLLVNGIVAFVESTERTVVLNYLSLRLMIQMSPFIPHTDLTDFSSALLYGKLQDSVPRWKMCLRVIGNVLFPIVYLSLLTDLSTDVSRFKFSDVINEAISRFVSGIETSPLFTSFSRSSIRKLLNRTHFKVLAPAWISDNALLNSYLRTISAIKPSDTAFESYVATFERAFVHSILHGYSDQWTHSAFSTRCYYDRIGKSLYFPLLVFNISTTKDAVSDYVQFPRVLFRVEKCLLEMMFEEASSAGNYESWFDTETRRKFERAERCFGVTLDELLQPGRFSRVTDALAMKFSFNMFKRGAESSGEKFGLLLSNGRHLTYFQLFFIFLVMQACETNEDRDTSRIIIIVILSKDAAVPSNGVQRVLRVQRALLDVFRWLSKRIPEVPDSHHVQRALSAFDCPRRIHRPSPGSRLDVEHEIGPEESMRCFHECKQSTVFSALPQLALERNRQLEGPAMKWSLHAMRGDGVVNSI